MNHKKKAVQITLGLGRTIGGGEYTAIIVAEFLKEVGFEVTLVAKRIPDPHKYLNAFKTAFPFDKVAVFKYPRLPKVFRLYHGLLYPIGTPNIDADLYFNTSADSHPFVLPLSAILNHKPIIYYVTALPLTFPWFIRDVNVFRSQKDIAKWKNLYHYFFKLICKRYWKGINSFFIACSRYIAEIIKENLGAKPSILYTPVDVKEYLWRGESKDDYAVAMGRLVPSKRYENAIIACKKAGVKLVILAAMQDESYYKYLLDIVKREGMEDRVSIILNAPLETRSNILRKAKVFIHCRIEAGAKAVREAIAAGCIPVVPQEGGQSEFVPKEFTYSTIEEMPQKILEALSAPESLRWQLIEEVKKHDKTNFKLNLRKILEDYGLLSSK
jgi:glycosyltransferase involved in cell wall biosynthesis